MPAARCCGGKATKSIASRPNPHGRVSENAVSLAIDDRTALVTMIHAQNEIGTLQPVAEIAKSPTDKAR